MPDPYLDHLTAALDRARARVAQCRAELERFDRFDRGESRMAPARDRLVEDLRQAEQDAAWAQIALADATSPMEVPAAG